MDVDKVQVTDTDGYEYTVTSVTVEDDVTYVEIEGMQ
jgi:hypothetical protein